MCTKGYNPEYISGMRGSDCKVQGWFTHWKNSVNEKHSDEYLALLLDQYNFSLYDNVGGSAKLTNLYYECKYAWFSCSDSHLHMGNISPDPDLIRF